MLSTFHSIETGKKSLITQQIGVNVAGHNIANMNNEKHSRVRVNLATDHELFPIGPSSPKLNGQIGSGVKIQSIERVRDIFLETRIIHQISSENYWSKLTSLLKKIESLYNEPGDLNLRSSLSRFIESWDKLSQYPTEFAHREVLKSRTEELTLNIQNLFRNLQEIRSRVDNEVDTVVQEINLKAKQVADLNQQILAFKAEGKSPNQLLDHRDDLISDLSKLADIEVSYQDHDDQVMLFIGSQILVQGKAHEKIEAISDPNNEGLKKLLWLNKQSEFIVKKGALSSLLETRDKIIPNQIKSLDHFSINLMETVNRLHEDGFGLNGEKGNPFFEKKYIGGTITSSFDPNQTGEASNLGIYRIHGNQTLKADDILGIKGTIRFKNPSGDLAEINYSETDTVNDIIKKINQSSASILAYLTSEGYLSLKAMPNLNSKNHDFHINYIEDTNVFLSEFSGIFNKNSQKVYNWEIKETFSNLDDKVSFYTSPYKHPSSWISIDKKISNNLDLIAAASGKNSNILTGQGDGTIALKIAASLNNSEEYYSKELREIAKYGFSLDKQANGFHQFLNQNLQKVAAYTEQSDLESKKSSSITKHLNAIKSSVSGVNLNEEVSSLLKYQHAYHASAKFITYVDKMLETLIFKLGA